jgi:hypothetical protein
MELTTFFHLLYSGLQMISSYWESGNIRPQSRSLVDLIQGSSRLLELGIGIHIERTQCHCCKMRTACSFDSLVYQKLQCFWQVSHWNARCSEHWSPVDGAAWRWLHQYMRIYCGTQFADLNCVQVSVIATHVNVNRPDTSALVWMQVFVDKRCQNVAGTWARLVYDWLNV